MAKTRLKQIFCIMLLFMVVICFCACSTVSVGTVINEDGSIDELVTVELDEKAIADANLNLDSVKSEIKDVAMNEAKQIVYQFENKIQSDLLLCSIETREILVSFIGGIQVVGNEWQDESYTIGIRFKNKDVYKYYYNITENVDVELTEEKHFLYNKYSYNAYTMYASYSDLYNKLSEYFSNKYPQFTDADVE